MARGKHAEAIVHLEVAIPEFSAMQYLTVSDDEARQLMRDVPQ